MANEKIVLLQGISLKNAEKTDFSLNLSVEINENDVCSQIYKVISQGNTDLTPIYYVTDNGNPVFVTYIIKDQAHNTLQVFLGSSAWYNIDYNRSFQRYIVAKYNFNRHDVIDEISGTSLFRNVSSRGSYLENFNVKQISLRRGDIVIRELGFENKCHIYPAKKGSKIGLFIQETGEFFQVKGAEEAT